MTKVISVKGGSPYIGAYDDFKPKPKRMVASAGDISWTIVFRNGAEKRIAFPVHRGGK